MIIIKKTISQNTKVILISLLRKREISVLTERLPLFIILKPLGRNPAEPTDINSKQTLLITQE
jgi:hypothetical protein